ncbi:MAG: hypothetical protein R2761_17960 [Acidimicrobiales bacterium]
MSLHVEYSALDSLRFGYRIARARIDGDDGGSAVGPDVSALVEALDGYDIAILRAPASLPHLAAALTMVPGWRSFTADHLMYWEWRGPTVEASAGDERYRIETCADAGRIEPMLRLSFTGYRNHYAANPLLDPAGALDGYVEWAMTMIGSGTALTKVAIDEAERVMAFGILDLSVELPDIRLAGVHPEAQGAGLYGQVVRELLAAAVTLDRLPVRISTQSDNTNVMRSWSRMGFVPVSALATFHLVADRLGPLAPRR